MRQPLFLGRERELEHLKLLRERGAASLVVVRGRRRIGKSTLIEKFAESGQFLEFAGLAPDGNETITAQDQRDSFAGQLSKQIGVPGIHATDWSDLFSLLAKHTKRKRVTILFDEISWMASEDPLFLGKLKNAWDLEFSKNPNLILVLCGSVSMWIEKKYRKQQIILWAYFLIYKTARIASIPLPQPSPRKGVPPFNHGRVDDSFCHRRSSVVS